MKTPILLGLLALGLSGCAGIKTDTVDATSGAAQYTYHKKLTHPDGTVEELDITATSAREITDGTLTILDDGTMETSVAKTEGGRYGQEMALELVRRLPLPVAP